MWSTCTPNGNRRQLFEWMNNETKQSRYYIDSKPADATETKAHQRPGDITTSPITLLVDSQTISILHLRGGRKRFTTRTRFSHVVNDETGYSVCHLWMGTLPLLWRRVCRLGTRKIQTGVLQCSIKHDSRQHNSPHAEQTETFMATLSKYHQIANTALHQIRWRSSDNRSRSTSSWYLHCHKVYILRISNLHAAPQFTAVIIRVRGVINLVSVKKLLSSNSM